MTTPYNLSSVRADKIVSTLRFRFEMAKSEATNIEVAVVLCASGFGVFQVCWVTAGEAGILCVCVRGQDGTHPLLLIPVEQCSFLVNLVAKNDQNDKQIVGFAEPPKS